MNIWYVLYGMFVHRKQGIQGIKNLNKMSFTPSSYTVDMF